MSSFLTDPCSRFQPATSPSSSTSGEYSGLSSPFSAHPISGLVPQFLDHIFYGHFLGKFPQLIFSFEALLMFSRCIIFYPWEADCG